MYAGIVIKIPSKNTFIIDPLGSLNLSEHTKNKIMRIEGKIVTKRSSIYLLIKHLTTKKID